VAGLGGERAVARSKRLRRTAVNDEGELLGHAGWVYSDLLLGIAVVFLAAVSFQAILPVLVELDEAADGEGQFEEEEEVVEAEPVSRQCLAGIALDHVEVLVSRDIRGDELARVALSQVSGELRQMGIDPETVTFGFMLAFGGADDPNQGIARARSSSDALRAAMPQRFERVVSRSYWGGRSPELVNNVRIDLFPYITEPCDDE
jgi:hypothetical protein